MVTDWPRNEISSSPSTAWGFHALEGDGIFTLRATTLFTAQLFREDGGEFFDILHVVVVCVAGLGEGGHEVFIVVITDSYGGDALAPLREAPLPSFARSQGYLEGPTLAAPERRSRG